MCQEKCPVKINTGDLIKQLRSNELAGSGVATGTGMWLANNFGLINASVPKLLNAVNLAHKVVGPKPLEAISRWLNRATGHFVPVWNPYMPKGAAPLLPATSAGGASAQAQASAVAAAAPAQRAIPRKVVYMPACVTRMMGPSASDYETASVHEKLMSLFGKAG